MYYKCFSFRCKTSKLDLVTQNVVPTVVDYDLILSQLMIIHTKFRYKKYMCKINTVNEIPYDCTKSDLDLF